MNATRGLPETPRAGSSARRSACRRRATLGRSAVRLRVGARPFAPPAAQFTPLPATPASERVLALLLPVGVTRLGRGCVRRVGDAAGVVELESDYRGSGVPEGARSVAFRFTFRAPVRTLPRHRGGPGRGAAACGARGGSFKCAGATSARPTAESDAAYPTIVPIEGPERPRAAARAPHRGLAGWRRRTRSRRRSRPRPSSHGEGGGPGAQGGRERLVELETENQACAIGSRRPASGSSPGRVARSWSSTGEGTRREHGNPRMRSASPSAARSTRSAPSCRRSTPARWRPTSTRRSSGCATRCPRSRATRSPSWPASAIIDELFQARRVYPLHRRPRHRPRRRAGPPPPSGQARQARGRLEGAAPDVGVLPSSRRSRGCPPVSAVVLIFLLIHRTQTSGGGRAAARHRAARGRGDPQRDRARGRAAPRRRRPRGGGVEGGGRARGQDGGPSAPRGFSTASSSASATSGSGLERRAEERSRGQDKKVEEMNARERSLDKREAGDRAEELALRAREGEADKLAQEQRSRGAVSWVSTAEGRAPGEIQR